MTFPKVNARICDSSFLKGLLLTEKIKNPRGDPANNESIGKATLLKAGLVLISVRITQDWGILGRMLAVFLGRHEQILGALPLIGA